MLAEDRDMIAAAKLTTSFSETELNVLDWYAANEHSTGVQWKQIKAKIVADLKKLSGSLLPFDFHLNTWEAFGNDIDKKKPDLNHCQIIFLSQLIFNAYLNAITNGPHFQHAYELIRRHTADISKILKELENAKQNTSNSKFFGNQLEAAEKVLSDFVSGKDEEKALNLYLHTIRMAIAESGFAQFQLLAQIRALIEHEASPKYCSLCQSDLKKPQSN